MTAQQEPRSSDRHVDSSTHTAPYASPAGETATGIGTLSGMRTEAEAEVGVGVVAVSESMAATGSESKTVTVTVSMAATVAETVAEDTTEIVTEIGCDGTLMRKKSAAAGSPTEPTSDAESKEQSVAMAVAWHAEPLALEPVLRWVLS